MPLLLLSCNMAASPSLEHHQHPTHMTSHMSSHDPSSVEIYSGIQEAQDTQALRKTRNEGGRRKKEPNDRTKLTDSKYIRG